jgi:hypothetical protein
MGGHRGIARYWIRARPYGHPLVEAGAGPAWFQAICGPATIGFLLGAGLGPTQVLWSLVPVALVAGLTAHMLLVTGKPAVQAPPYPLAST